MRAPSAAVCLILAAAAAAGCKSSAGAADASRPGVLVCPQPLPSDCSTTPLYGGAILCTLDQGIQVGCGLCRGPDAGCASQGALLSGTRYSYIQFVNVDVWWIFVYDQNQNLVAELEFNLSGTVAAMPWSCVVGPDTFDASEAMDLLPIAGRGELLGACGSAADAGP